MPLNESRSRCAARLFPKCASVTVHTGSPQQASPTGPRKRSLKRWRKIRFSIKFSLLLKQAIDDYHAQRISDAEYLAKVTEIMEQVRDGKMKEAPDLLKERDLSRAFFGALQKELSEEGRSGNQ